MLYHTPDKTVMDTDDLTIPVDHQILIRGDGRIEHICEHGVGHPIGHVHKWVKWMGVHGCCGCCSQWADE